MLKCVKNSKITCFKNNLVWFFNWNVKLFDYISQNFMFFFLCIVGNIIYYDMNEHTWLRLHIQLNKLAKLFSNRKLIRN
jgi:hypothetical protein